MSSNRFDGLEVDNYLARFSGTFELEPYEVDSLSADSTIVAVVVARVEGAQFRVDKKSGDVKRVNTLGVSGFAVVEDPKLRELLFQHLASLQTDTPLPFPATIELGNTTVDTITGEVQPIDQEAADWLASLPEEEEIFVPGRDDRMPVGGATHNDPVLRRFIDGG